VAVAPDAAAAASDGNGQRPPMAITVASLAKNYGEIEAVRGIDFEVPVGETFGFLGPNGAGKSTTIKISPARRTCVSTPSCTGCPRPRWGRG